MRNFVRLQVVLQLQSAVLIRSDTLTTVPDVLSDCSACIFRNANHSIISQAIYYTGTLVWWPGCQQASANKRLNSIQRIASFRLTRTVHTAPNVTEALTFHPPTWHCGSRQGRLAAGGACLTTPIKNILLYGCNFKQWNPYLVYRITQWYFKNFPCFTL